MVKLLKLNLEEFEAGILDRVLVRVSNKSKLDFHVDIDEANCLLIKDKDTIQIVK